MAKLIQLLLKRHKIIFTQSQKLNTMKKLIKYLAIGFVLLFLIGVFFGKKSNKVDGACEYPGCTSVGIGWVKCKDAPSGMKHLCSGGAIRYETEGGYCSKEHAAAD
jgi:hypothetical protein